MKTTVVHHSADFDGIFCREVARRFLPPDTEFIGWDWRDAKIPFPSEGDVYVLDLSPDCFESIPKYQERLIWIDHHKSAIDKFPTVWPGYRIDGVAACRLAWQWFTENQVAVKTGGAPQLPNQRQFIERIVTEPLAVRLAGEYDIWDHRDPRALMFQFGLRSRELDVNDWDNMLGNITENSITVDGLLALGKPLYEYQKSADASNMIRSFIVEFDGLKFLALNTSRCNSLTFDSRDIPETGHDALMAFYFDGEKWNVSMYHAKHRTDLDLSVIAVRQYYNGKNGGGHRGACGFQSNSLPFLPLKSELRIYLDGQKINSENIGEIRRACFVPWDSEWNAFVRDETAARENKT
jgi:uncharacterized protein